MGRRPRNPTCSASSWLCCDSSFASSASACDFSAASSSADSCGASGALGCGALTGATGRSRRWLHETREQREHEHRGRDQQRAGEVLPKRSACAHPCRRRRNRGRIGARGAESRLDRDDGLFVLCLARLHWHSTLVLRLHFGRLRARPQRQILRHPRRPKVPVRAGARPRARRGPARRARPRALRARATAARHACAKRAGCSSGPRDRMAAGPQKAGTADGIRIGVVRGRDDRGAAGTQMRGGGAAGLCRSAERQGGSEVDEPRAPARIEQHVARLHVAVRIAERVQMGERRVDGICAVATSGEGASRRARPDRRPASTRARARTRRQCATRP